MLLPRAVALPADEVHVWRAELDQPPEVLRRLAETLSPDERARAGRLHFEVHRRRAVASRGILRAILASHQGAAPDRLAFRYGPRGKPSLAGSAGDGTLRFNVAHAGGLALYAVARGREVGIDVEVVRAGGDFEQIALRFFSPRERAALAAVPPDRRAEAFSNGWTRKEAYLKALGDGLSRPLDSFDVSLAPGEPAALLAVRGAPAEAGRRALRALPAPEGHSAALAVEGHGWRLACWQWSGAPEWAAAAGKAPAAAPRRPG